MRYPDSIQVQLDQSWTHFSNVSIQAESKDALLYVWSLSGYAQWVSQHHVNWLAECLASNEFEKSHSPALLDSYLSVLSDITDKDALIRLLREVRHRYLFRIIWRDMHHLAILDETLEALSDLADALVNIATDWLYNAHCQQNGIPIGDSGQQQYLIVFALGKLGGKELNFSSDIDLVFAFSETGNTGGDQSISNQTFFERLCKDIIQVLANKTSAGFVYRVDTRLRPFGDSGQLVCNLNTLSQYLLNQGRAWERYAWLKARQITAHDSSIEDELSSFVYRRYTDYAMLGHLRDLKQKIIIQLREKGRETDIKKGRGGIRSLEFIVQVFQLIYGGHNKLLRGNTFKGALMALRESELVDADDAIDIKLSYHFLRMVENRIQMFNDEQTHQIPSSDIDKWRLHTGFGYSDWQAFETALQESRELVAEHFNEIFDTKDTNDESSEMSDYWLAVTSISTVDAENILNNTGFGDVSVLNNTIKAFAEKTINLNDSLRNRLNKLIPSLLNLASQKQYSPAVISLLLEFMQTIYKRGNYLSLFIEQPQALINLANLFDRSPWVARYITQHPLLVDELLDSEQIHVLPGRHDLVTQLNYQLQGIDADDISQFMDSMRYFKHRQVLRVITADVLTGLPLMKVSDQITWIAEVVIAKLLDHAYKQLVTKHGYPTFELDGQSHDAQFLVIGYGKLGGIEMSYNSDVDLVFLHDSQGEKQLTNGTKPIDNSTFFIRLGQLIINSMSTLTSAGRLYEVDMRLRPSGNAGLLVSSVESFANYQQDKAWLWEHQALVKARPVAGSIALSKKFEQLRHHILAQPRDQAQVASEVRDMRQKMWHQNVLSAKKFNLKTSPGGIIDIEFMVQYMVLAYAAQYPSITVHTDNIRLLHSLAKAKLMTMDDAQQLASIYQRYRDRVHRCNLQDDSIDIAKSEFCKYQNFVRDYWQKLFAK